MNLVGFQLSPGEQGISESLSAMAEVVRQVPILRTVGTGQRVIDRAAALAAGVGGQATSAHSYALAVYDFLREHIEFTKDPPFIELVQHPDELLGIIEARGKARCDCDEVATLGAALLWARGIEPVFLVVSKPGTVKLTHVFYGARIGGRVVPFDPQERIPPGRWPFGAIGRLEAYRVIPPRLAGALEKTPSR